MLEAFDSIDKDHDGFLSKTELKEEYQIDNDQVDKLFKQLGKDNDEQVSYEGMLHMQVFISTIVFFFTFLAGQAGLSFKGCVNSTISIQLGVI